MVLCCTGINLGLKYLQTGSVTQEQGREGKRPRLRYLSPRKSASCTSRGGKPPWLAVGAEKIPGYGQGGWHWAARAHHGHFQLKVSVGAGRSRTAVSCCHHLPAEALGVAG